MAHRKEPIVADSILDQLLNGADAKTTFESNGLFDQLKKALADVILDAEMGHFPTDEAAMKLLFLVLNRSEKEWKMPPREWSMAKSQFSVMFGDRFKAAMA